MNWYIGQEIVAVHNSSCGKLHKGDIRTIKGLRSGVCRCRTHIHMDIGESSPLNLEFVTCPDCRTIVKTFGAVWYKEVFFAPLQTASEEADMKEAIEESFFHPATL